MIIGKHNAVEHFVSYYDDGTFRMRGPSVTISPRTSHRQRCGRILRKAVRAVRARCDRRSVVMTRPPNLLGA